MACQLHQSCEKAMNGNMKKNIENGEFKEIREWLRVNIHSKGSLYDKPDDLMKEVTGSPLDPTVFVNYLNKKYSDIYKL